MKQILKELRPDGIVNLENESLSHLDHSFTGESMAVPVKLNRDGSISKTSKAVSHEDFYTMLSFAEQKNRSIREEIRQGEVKIQPYRQGTKSGCDYCVYQHICGFDVRLPGYRYRDISKLSGGEVLERMRGETERDKEERHGD